MSQIVAHDPAAVFQDCHPGADALRRQCAGHVGRCAGNGRGFQSSVAHVSPDFAVSPAASIVASRSVKTAPLMRMDAFDEVQFKEQFRFSKAEFCVILSNMLDLDGDKLVDDVASSVMIHGAQKDAPCRTIH
jgi:hypothetical protein